MALTQVTKDVLHSSQGNITTVGTLTSLSVSGNATVGNIIATNFTYANGTSILTPITNAWQANAATQSGEITNLWSNAATQSGEITNLWSNAATQSGEITNLWSNAAAQSSQIASKANLTGAAFTGNISTTANVKFTGWQIYEISNTLYFAYNGAVKMSLNTSGNLTVTGDVAGFGAP